MLSEFAGQILDSSSPEASAATEVSASSGIMVIACVTQGYLPMLWQSIAHSLQSSVSAACLVLGYPGTINGASPWKLSTGFGRMQGAKP